MNSKFKHLMAITTIAMLLTGCQEDEERIRRAQAEAARKARLWQHIATVLGTIAVVSLGAHLWARGGTDGSAGGGRRSGGPGDGTKPTAPTGARQQQLEQASNGSVQSLRPTVPRLVVANNEIRKPAVAAPSGSPRAAELVPFPGRSAPQSRYFVLDGLNICLSYQSDRRFRLETLLTLVTQLLQQDIGLECHFDTSGKYWARKNGSEPQRNAYEALLKRHPELFSEVPAIEPADSTVLFRANSKSCPVISNDRFNKATENYRERYAWLNDEGRLVGGRRFRNRLVIEALGIDAPIPPDLETAMREFETAYTGFTGRQDGRAQLAA